MQNSQKFKLHDIVLQETGTSPSSCATGVQPVLQHDWVAVFVYVLAKLEFLPFSPPKAPERFEHFLIGF